MGTVSGCLNPFPNSNALPPVPGQTSEPLPEGTSPPVTQDAGQTPASWASEDINRAISMEILPMDLCGQYTSAITREEFCRVLVGLLQSKGFTGGENPYDSAPNPFSDTSSSDVAWLSSLGIVNGVGGDRFNPAGSITRQEAAVMLKRAAVTLGFADTDGSVQFKDSDQIASWAKDDVRFIVGHNIMNGTGDGFSPKDTYTRQQSFVTVMRLYDRAPESSD
jgi:hypothetical protein